MKTEITDNAIESNKLIAEFMEVEPKLIGMYYYYDDGVFFRMREKNYEKAKQHIAEYVKYHSSWDWLMPVVQKIEQIEGVYDCEEFLLIRDELCTARIDTVYSSVVDFINWYNQSYNDAK